MVLRTDDATVELITRQESEDVLKIRGGRQRLETFLQLLEAKIALLAEKDHLLDYVVLALSDELYRRCKVVDYFEKGKGGVYRDLRRAGRGDAKQGRDSDSSRFYNAGFRG